MSTYVCVGFVYRRKVVSAKKSNDYGGGWCKMLQQHLTSTNCYLHPKQILITEQLKKRKALRKCNDCVLCHLNRSVVLYLAKGMGVWVCNIIIWVAGSQCKSDYCCCSFFFIVWQWLQLILLNYVEIVFHFTFMFFFYFLFLFLLLLQWFSKYVDIFIWKAFRFYKKAYSPE